MFSAAPSWLSHEMIPLPRPSVDFAPGASSNQRILASTPPSAGSNHGTIDDGPRRARTDSTQWLSGATWGSTSLDRRSASTDLSRKALGAEVFTSSDSHETASIRSHRRYGGGQAVDRHRSALLSQEGAARKTSRSRKGWPLKADRGRALDPLIWPRANQIPSHTLPNHYEKWRCLEDNHGQPPELTTS